MFPWSLERHIERIIRKPSGSWRKFPQLPRQGSPNQVPALRGIRHRRVRIVDTQSGEIEVRTKPQGAYTQIATFKRGETIRLQQFPDVAIGVDEVFFG